MNSIPTVEADDDFRTLIDRLDEDGIVITKDGQPVAKLTKYEGISAHLIGCMEGEVEVLGDIFSTGIKWEAQRDVES